MTSVFPKVMTRVWTTMTLLKRWTKDIADWALRMSSTLFEFSSMTIKSPKLKNFLSSGLLSKFQFRNKSALLFTQLHTKWQSKSSKVVSSTKLSTRSCFNFQAWIPKLLQHHKRNLHSLVLHPMAKKLETESKDLNQNLLPVSSCTWCNGKVKDLVCLHQFLPK